MTKANEHCVDLLAEDSEFADGVETVEILRVTLEQTYHGKVVEVSENLDTGEETRRLHLN